MSIYLVDTNIVSALFKPGDRFNTACSEVARGNQLVISFASRAELMLWPARNSWGNARRNALFAHLELYTTIYPDRDTCESWVRVQMESQKKGRPLTTNDAWIASLALQWDLPLVTIDHRDFAHLSELKLLPIPLP